MDQGISKPSIRQPRLFHSGIVNARLLELFPTLWSAVEDLSSPDRSTRLTALDYLEESGAARISPLVTYVIATCLTDPDPSIRAHVVKILGDVLTTDDEGNPAEEQVLNHLNNYLFRMRTRQVFSIIEALACNSHLAAQVIRLLLACPYSGDHLIDIVHSRKAPFEIRKTAIWLISEVGYVDAIPALERLQLRMETRMNGQQSMPFAPQEGEDESGLLPSLRNALALLRSP